MKFIVGQIYERRGKRTGNGASLKDRADVEERTVFETVGSVRKSSPGNCKFKTTRCVKESNTGSRAFMSFRSAQAAVAVSVARVISKRGNRLAVQLSRFPHFISQL